MKLFDEKLPFLKGNFHTHTTESDGQMTPAEAMKAYRQKGYDFLAVTDHRKLTVPQSGEIPEGLIWIPGTELDYTLENQVCHLLGLGIRPGIEKLYDKQKGPQHGIDAIHACGGLAVLAHPSWSLNTTGFMLELDGVDAVEIWNSVSMPPYNAARGDSSMLLDPVFAHNRLWPVLANDDTHYYGEDFARGWNMVQPRARTAQAILEAVREGRAYCTQGPEIRQITYENHQITVETSPCDRVIFYSNRVYSRGRCVTPENGTYACWNVLPDETFVRIEVIAGDKRAFSSPLRTV